MTTATLKPSPSTIASSISAWHTRTVTAEQFKQIVEATGFAARFDSAAVKTALLTFCDSETSVVMEISKNAKPSDVALRYSRETWVPGDTQTSMNSLTTEYHSIVDLPAFVTLIDSVLAADAVCRRDQKNPVRIDLKAKVLAVARTETEEIIAESISFEPNQAPAKEKEERPMTTSTASRTNESLERAAVQPAQERYSSYSMSEVDRLLKVQAEAITASLSTKISAQAKSFQEITSEQARTFDKAVSKLSDTIDEFRTRIEKSNEAHSLNSHQQMARFNADLAKELEQFKVSLSKSIVPSIKAIDEKLKGDQRANVAAPAATPVPSNNSVLTAMIAVTIVLNAVSIALQFIHH